MREMPDVERIYTGVGAVVGWAVLGLQLYLIIAIGLENGSPSWWSTVKFFSYFTVLSNIIVAVGFTAMVFARQSPLGDYFMRPETKAAVAVYIALVGLTYNVILRYIWNPQGLSRVADEGLHVVMPLIYIIYWLVFAPKQQLEWRSFFPWMVLPAAYLIYALALGAASGFYTYPFIDAGKIGYPQVAINALGVMAVFIVISLIFIGLDQAMDKRLNRST